MTKVESESSSDSDSDSSDTTPRADLITFEEYLRLNFFPPPPPPPPPPAPPAAPLTFAEYIRLHYFSAHPAPAAPLTFEEHMRHYSSNGEMYPNYQTSPMALGEFSLLKKELEEEQENKMSFFPSSSSSTPRPQHYFPAHPPAAPAAPLTFEEHMRHYSSNGEMYPNYQTPPMALGDFCRIKKELEEQQKFKKSFFASSSSSTPRPAPPAPPATGLTYEEYMRLQNSWNGERPHSSNVYMYPNQSPSMGLCAFHQIMKKELEEREKKEKYELYYPQPDNSAIYRRLPQMVKDMQERFKREDEEKKKKQEMEKKLIKKEKTDWDSGVSSPVGHNASSSAEVPSVAAAADVSPVAVEVPSVAADVAPSVAAAPDTTDEKP